MIQRAPGWYKSYEEYIHAVAAHVDLAGMDTACRASKLMQIGVHTKDAWVIVRNQFLDIVKALES